jgi:crotonobetaine/carnitine-CoA ligase
MRIEAEVGRDGVAAALTGFEGQDVRALIERKASERTDHPFLMWEPFEGLSETWTYRQAAERIRRVAAGLSTRGVRPGERILIHLDNRPEFIFAWLGCAYAGVVAVTTNTRSTADDIAYFATHSDAVGAITETAYVTDIGAALPPSAWRLNVDDAGGLDELEGAAADLPDRPFDQHAPFGIQYTSGTTARPKAVLWSHANALWGARVSAMHEGLTPDDVHLVFLPLFHTNAQVYSVLASLWAGATVVLQPRFSASRFWPVALRRRCTWTSVVPFCTAALLDQPVPDAHYFRFFGAAVMLPEVEARLGVRTVTWWGMTETVTHGIVSAPDRAAAPFAMGFASPAYEILVLDEAMQPVDPGVIGDLYVRGRRGLSLFVEYVGDPAASEAAFTGDGLFITGDRVLRGPDGSLFFIERAKDMLKVGGENVAAIEIERVILAVDGVAEVAVVGMDHAMLDEVPVAFVITRGSDPTIEARILSACESGLAAFKRPRQIHRVEDLPRSTLNKVAKASLRAWLKDPNSAFRASSALD